jgi:PAS domain S-box-containing protein
LKAALEAVVASLPADLSPDLALLRKLRRSEARYRTLVSLSSNVVWVRDANLNFTEPCPAWEQFTGQTFEEYKGRGWLNAIHPEDQINVRPMLEPAIAAKQPLVMVRYRLWRARTRDGVRGGEYRHCEVMAAPVLDESGEILEWVGMLKDRTEQHEAEAWRIMQTEELARSNRDLEDFAYIAAHDLKEPLRGIRLIASFLAEDTKGKLDEDAQRRLGQLHDLCERMQLLLDSLLESAKVASVPLNLEIAEVSGLVAEASQLVGARIRESDAKVKVDPGAEGARVCCDQGRMAQVIANLIANGIKYNDSQEKSIEIGVSRADEPETLVISVRDNGIGIPLDQQDQIFRMFRRLHPRECYGGGAGAGLAIVKKIIERHGGRIWVESEPKRGTTFYFTVRTAEGCRAIRARSEDADPPHD